MNVASQKHDLRRAMKAVVQGVSENTRRACSARVRSHVAAWLDQVMPHRSLLVGLFASLPDEISTLDLDHYLVERGAQRAVACVDDRDELFFHDIAFDQPAHEMSWRQTARAPHTPLAHFDVIFVPGLAFDEAGHRLGRGRGCFDRALKDLPRSPKRPLLVGILFDEQLIATVPHLAHDISVDYLCTPQRGMLKAPTRVSHA